MRKLWIVPVLGGMLVGCGGGGGQPLTVGGTGEVVAGSMKLSGQINQPQVFTGGATVYALTGAIAKATYFDATPTVAETEIVFPRGGQTGYELMACSPDGSGVRKVCDLPGVVADVEVHPSGSYVYFLSSNTLYRVAFAGGGAPATLSNDVSQFDITPSGNKIVYRKSIHDGWWVANSTMGSPFRLTTDTTVPNLTGTVSDVTALLNNQSSDAIYEQSLIGSSNPVLRLSVGPDLGFSACPDTGDEALYLQLSGGLFTVKSILTTGSTASWIFKTEGSGQALLQILRGTSPDHQTLLFGDGPTGVVYTTPRDGSAKTIIQQDNGAAYPAWSPYLTSRMFVGTASWPAAAAFLFSEAGTQVPTVVLADATTRASMAVQKISEQGDSNVVLKLTCDQLTKLYYTTGANFVQKAVVLSGTGLKGAYVSFDAATGKASTIVTFQRPVRESRVGGRVFIDADDAAKVFFLDRVPKAPREGRIQL